MRDMFEEFMAEHYRKNSELGAEKFFPEEIGRQFQPFVTSWGRAAPQPGQNSGFHNRNDMVDVESLWSVQPDLKNKFL